MKVKKLHVVKRDFKVKIPNYEIFIKYFKNLPTNNYFNNFKKIVKSSLNCLIKFLQFIINKNINNF